MLTVFWFAVLSLFWRCATGYTFARLNHPHVPVSSRLNARAARPVPTGPPPPAHYVEYLRGARLPPAEHIEKLKALRAEFQEMAPYLNTPFEQWDSSTPSLQVSKAAIHNTSFKISWCPFRFSAATLAGKRCCRWAMCPESQRSFCRDQKVRHPLHR